MYNGAIVTKDMQMNAAKDDPEAVVTVAYLKGENRVHATITTSGVYVTGKIQVEQMSEKTEATLQ